MFGTSMVANVELVFSSMNDPLLWHPHGGVPYGVLVMYLHFGLQIVSTCRQIQKIIMTRNRFVYNCVIMYGR